MNPRIVDKSEIPEDAVRCHLYDYRYVLMPRGSMKKESIGPYLLERLKGCYEDWTDEKYGDNPPLPDLIQNLYTNLNREVEQAWFEFIEHATTGLTDSELLKLKLAVIAIAKPDFKSDYIEWFIETITSDLDLFVEAIGFIDKYDRRSLEFAYFTDIHLKATVAYPKYAELMESTQDPNSELAKMFEKYHK